MVAVDEGALAKYADAVVEPDAGPLAVAALQPERRELTLETPEQIATRVLAFYEVSPSPSGTGSG